MSMPMSMSTLYIDTYTYTRFVSASMQGNERYTHMSIYTYIHIYIDISIHILYQTHDC